MKKKDTTATKRHDPDVELMLAFKDGDEEAFVQLYEKYRDRIVNFTRRFMGNLAQSEEAAQDVFLKLYKTKSRYTPTARFSTFLFRIATNHCLNLQARHDTKLVDRNKELGERQSGISRSSLENPEESTQRLQLRKSLTNAMENLPENQRMALVLCHYEGMSYREASTMMKLTESAVKSLLHRAREKLTKELRPLQHLEATHHAM